MSVKYVGGILKKLTRLLLAATLQELTQPEERPIARFTSWKSHKQRHMRDSEINDDATTTFHHTIVLSWPARFRNFDDMLLYSSTARKVYAHSGRHTEVSNQRLSCS